MSFVRNAWYMAGWVPDLPKNELVALTLLGDPIVLYSKSDGGWAALEDVCCHRLAPLSLGRLEGNEVRCMYHGLKFACTGQCTEIPGQERISPNVKVRSYPAVQKWGAVWIWMGQPDLADETLIPKIPAPDSTELSVLYDAAEVEASAPLIWDNLLDLSHVVFVHLASFMFNNEKMAKIALAGETVNKDIEKTDKGIRVKRWHYDKGDHPIFGDIVYDDCVLSDFDIPGNLLLEFISYKPGVRDRHPDKDIYEFPEDEHISTRYSCQIVTPIDDHRSKIFFSSGVLPDYADKMPKIFAVIQKALVEDKIIVDAQQAMMDRLSDRKVMNLGIDAPVVQFHALLNKRLEAEAAAG